MEKKALRKLIGSKLKEARGTKYNQSDLAEHLGMENSGSYGHIETGRNLIRLDHLIKLSKLLGKPLSFFIGEPTKENLSPEEEELLELYRSLPEGFPKEYALVSLRSLTQYSEPKDP